MLVCFIFLVNINFIPMFSDPFSGSRQKRALIRPLETNKNTSTNIFASPLHNPEDFSPSELHHIVGDIDWKRMTYHHLVLKKQTIIVNEPKEDPKGFNTSILKGSGSSKKDSSIIPITTQHSMNNTCGTKFCLDQIDKDTRERRTIQKYTQTQSGWKDVERGLLNKAKRNNSISYNAVKDVYLHPNPNKLDLINDDIPQYWQHSLRDNCKSLYKHLRNNPFKNEAAEEMLQTLAGRRKL